MPFPDLSFCPHQEEPEEHRDPSEEPTEDTEVDELWASLEAAAKRKLLLADQTPGALGTREKKKRRVMSASP